MKEGVEVLYIEIIVSRTKDKSKNSTIRYKKIVDNMYIMYIYSINKWINNKFIFIKINRGKVME